MKRFAEFIAEMYQEIERADAKHGDWSDRLPMSGVSAIYDELDELHDATCAMDVTGPHGIKAESIQVAVTAFKLWRRVS